MHRQDLTAEKRRRQRVSRNLTLTIIVANIIGALLAVTFFSLEAYTTAPDTAGQSYIGNGPLIAILIVAGTLIGNWLTRPLNQWYDADDDSQPLTPQIQRQALNNPLNSALISLSMWVLAGTMSAWSVHSEGINASLTVFMGMAGVAGPVTTLLIYFAMERIWSPEIPLFFPTHQPSDLNTFRLSVRWRLLVPSMLELVIMLIMTLSVTTTLNQVSTLEPAARALPLQTMLHRQIFLFGIAILITLSLTLTLGRHVANAVENLRLHMIKVRQGQLEASLPVISNDELGDLAAGFNAMVQGLQQEEVVRQLFSLYVTPEVATHAITHGAQRGGELAEATILFADIRGFTSMTERLGPEAVIALLNRYFEAMSAVITAHGGLVNKFGGDSLLAVFGSPLNATEDHPARAIRSAQGMLAALEAFNVGQRARNEPELRIGIGVATGAVVAGNVGSAERLEYTVIGDTVNLASRLEELTKTLKTSVLLAESTAAGAPDAPPLTQIADVEIRGKTGQMKVYTLVELM
ncbi:MAG: adenylate/guanylate cyclase domain-containing protein [Anaerolineae bacterium]|nr:adenylate/guanylate cyclase domain-containing protein [Anaerolineae bacterium]